MEGLEGRVLLSLLGQQIFPSDYPWNQNISNAPVAANSAAIISHIGSSIHIHPDWGADSAANGASPLYGIPFNVVHGNTTAKINVIIDNYPGESDIEAVPIPAGAVIEGDYQNGPNPNGGGYNAGQRGDSHLIVWDEDNNVAYELYGVTRPSDPTLFPNTNGVELNHTDNLWHAAQETVWNMSTDQFRTLGATSADAAGLSILAGLARPDEGLTVAQGGQGAINHALRMTLPSGDINPQYIYPASHMVSTSQATNHVPLGARLRLMNTPAVNAIISAMPVESQIVARAMQQYGLVVADIGSAMYVTGASASVDANNAIDQTWDMNDIFASNGLKALTAADFEVVNLTPTVTGLSASSGATGSALTITGQNFSGAAGHISVFFGATAASNVNVVSDMQITCIVPNGTGTVDVTVQSGVNETDNISGNPNANVNAPIFGYGTSATSSADRFTFGAFVPVSVSGNVFNDLNGDGAQQAGEGGLSGWTVDLMSGSTVVKSATTDANGNYSISGIGAGSYTVKEVVQGNYLETGPSGGSYNFTAASGVNVSNDNFGDFLVGTFSAGTLAINLDPSAAMGIGTSGSNTVVTVAGSNFSFAGVTNVVVASVSGGTLNFNGLASGAVAFSGDSGADADVVNVNSGVMNFAVSPVIAVGSLAIGTGASAVMGSAMSAQTQLVLGGLMIAATGRLDIANNEVFLQYGASDPIGTIAGWIGSGFNGGAWNGTGIVSSNAAKNSTSYGVGYADAADAGNPAGLSSGQIEMKYTLLGDADLNGVVNGLDFGIMAANFNKSVSSGWDQGDFDYNGIVNGIDFGLMSANFNKGVSLGSAEGAVFNTSVSNGVARRSLHPRPKDLSRRNK
jgi:hypothetical protein